LTVIFLIFWGGGEGVRFVYVDRKGERREMKVHEKDDPF
jgi:hypothetical protein